MISRPSTFEAFHRQNGAECHAILKLTDGTNTYYFGDIDMDLTNGHVYPVLKPNWKISESVNIFSKRWSISSLDVDLINIDFKGDPAGRSKVSDLVGSMQNQLAYLYLASGPNVASLSDCLLRFKGKILDPPEYDQDTCRITIADIGTIIDKMLPGSIMQDSYPTCPWYARDERVPLVYGDWTGGTERDYSGVGLARVMYDKAADHALHAMTDYWRKDKDLPDPVHPISATLTTSTSSGGSTRAIVSAVSTLCDAYVYPTATDLDGYSFDSLFQNNTDRVVDHAISTYATMTNNLVTGNGTSIAPEGMIAMSFDADQFIGDAAAQYQSGFKFKTKAATEGSMTITAREARLYYANDGATPASNDSYTSTALGSSTNWQTTGSYLAIPSSTADSKPYILAFHATGAVADGGTELTGMIELQEMLLVVKYRYNRTKNAGEPSWLACEGREYGSWITASGRSIDSKASGDLIRDPVHIIESLLRDELGLATASIDTASMDDAYNSSVYARMNLHGDNAMMAFEAVQQLAKQSTFAFILSATGKARAIDLDNSSPTTDRVLPYSHIDDRGMRVTKTTDIVNKLIVKSRYLPEYDIYADVTTFENSTSQSTYGTREKNLEWENICSTAATTVGNHLVSDADGIWSNAHNQIEFTTLAFTNADVEVGDWLEIESAPMDKQMMVFGTSWSGKQFLVVGVTQTMAGTQLKAIELY